jgi:8-oxo-dGTP pyrophosphatase MutT (NUDIX family)
LLRQVRAAVENHAPSDEREITSKSAFLVALDHLPRPLDRLADPTHVTASGIVVGPRGTVLHRHKRLHTWLQPGGHLDEGEAPWDTAIRETREETGIVGRQPASGPTLVHLDVHPAPPGHIHLDLRYLVETSQVALRPGPGESGDVRWFSWDEAIAVADAALLGALRRLRT